MPNLVFPNIKFMNTPEAFQYVLALIPLRYRTWDTTHNSFISLQETAENHADENKILSILN